MQRRGTPRWHPMRQDARGWHSMSSTLTQPHVLEVDIGIETVFSVVFRSTSRLSHKILLDISDILAKQSKGNTLNIAAVLDGIQILEGPPLEIH